MTKNRSDLDGRCATSRYLQVLGNIHDIQSYFGITNNFALSVQIYLCHWGHLAVIFAWLSAIDLHIGSHGNYQLWRQNPINCIPIAHAVLDPHFALSEVTNNVAHSGVFNSQYSLGLSSERDLYNVVIACQLAGQISCGLAFIHLIYDDGAFQCRGFLTQSEAISQGSKGSKGLYGPVAGWLPTAYHSMVLENVFDLVSQRFNFHMGVLIAFSSIAWSAHLVHIAIPRSWGEQTHQSGLKLLLSAVSGNSGVAAAGGVAAETSSAMSQTGEFYTANWAYDVASIASDQNIFSHSQHAGSSIITFFGGLKPDTISIYLTDIAHHHLALGVLLVLVSHVYAKLYKSSFFEGSLPGAADGPTARSFGPNLELSLACAGLAIITSVVADEISSVLVPYVYLSYDYVTTVALYVHHQYIAALLMMATVLHAAVSFITDYGMFASTSKHHLMLTSPNGADQQHLLYKMKAQLISHMSWACLFLGFHTLGVYVHNDTASAFGESASEIRIEPLFAMSLSARFKTSCPLGPGDFLFHHAIALGLHVTVLILLKGSLDAPGSRLMPDKINFALSFPCDGPTRGGTCDISAFDSFYLAFFWMLNTHAWITFYFHGKHLSLFEYNTISFDQSSTYLNAWFRDYLFFQSASLVNAYNAFGSNDLSVLSWMFLLAHLCWATGFMFLISWRGYWQELIDIILVMHLKTPMMYDIWTASLYTPLALSILQARFVGLVHFSAGFILTYAAFVLAATT